MGRAARARREHFENRRSARTLHVLFCDVDYARSSRAHGRPPAPPEGWVIERAGLLHAEWDGAKLRITADQILSMRHPASMLVQVLGAADLVVGHGILTQDLRAAAMVTDVPDTVLHRTVDLLALAHRVRGERWPTGCSLSELARRNLPAGLSTPHSFCPVPVPGWPAGPYRERDDPREDAAIVADLWQTLLTSRQLAWGLSTRGAGGQEGSAALDVQYIQELTGSVPQIEAQQWRERLRAGGRVLLPTALDGHAAVLARLSARDLPDPAQVRELAHRLGEAGAVPPHRQWSDEELYTACQYLGLQQNIEARERIAEGRRLTKVLRENLGWALWLIAHPDWAAAYSHFSRLAHCRDGRDDTVSALLRMQTLQPEKDRLRSTVAAILA